MIRIGSAGWSIPKAVAGGFPAEGSHLERYARQMRAVEINSSFHRPHRVQTYARWAAAVPPDFSFSVKVPKSITHERRLIDVAGLIEAFATEVHGLGDKLRVALVQLPPTFAFDRGLVERFFLTLRRRLDVMHACEPRHATWFTPEADQCLAGLRVARVAAHPVLAVGGERPGGWQGLHYRRLHGAPRVYYSSYEQPFLETLASTLVGEISSCAEQWCIFDNTASGAATADALALQSMLKNEGR